LRKQKAIERIDDRKGAEGHRGDREPWREASASEGTEAAEGT
jgi:hypothetical protein